MDVREAYLRFRDLMPAELAPHEVADLCCLIIADYAPTRMHALRITAIAAMTVQAQKPETFTPEGMN